MCKNLNFFNRKQWEKEKGKSKQVNLQQYKRRKAGKKEWNKLTKEENKNQE